MPTLTPLSVLIVGCGYVGNALARRLLLRGDRVWGLRHNVDRLAPGVRGIRHDMRRTPPSLPAVDVVVSSLSPVGRGADDYRAAYLDAIHSLADGFAGAGHRPTVAIMLSTTGVYSYDDGREVTEATTPTPSAKTAFVLAGEDALHERFPRAATAALRLGGIYGPGRTRLLESVRDGTVVRPDGTAHTNRIHRDDAAGALLHLIDRQRAGHPLRHTYLGVDGSPARRADVVRWLAGRIGVPVAATNGGAAPPSRRATDKRCRNDALREAGYRFLYPSFREGYGALVAMGRAP